MCASCALPAHVSVVPALLAQRALEHLFSRTAEFPEGNVFGGGIPSCETSEDPPKRAGMCPVELPGVFQVFPPSRLKRLMVWIP